MIGQTISHYRVLDKLGQGGMGVVYKAEDTKLDRPVALKLLPAHLLGNEDIRKRFEREAKSAAALDHPHVCHVYEIDEADGQSFIAMSLIEGESLDKKIARGPLKLEEALSIAQQVAKGLEAAHNRGIVHRDIKPENIMVGEDGHVTIMDFGLAQLTEASRLTKTDETVGTVAYMSPEQTEGAGTDHRTDIWSLGVVIYEMVTGQQPFKGDYDKAVMYSILNEEPEPITALRAGVPMELEVFVRKCLMKSPGDRYAIAAELATDLRTLADSLSPGRSAAVTTEGGQPSPDSSSMRLRLAWLLVCAFGACLIAIGLRHFLEESGSQRLRRYALAPDNLAVQAFPAVSPDGNHVVYEGSDGRLWVQDLDRKDPRPLEQTEGARAPFWSPHSDIIGFFTRTEVKRIPVAGGAAMRICELDATAEVFSSGAWSPDGDTIVFAGGNVRTLYEVSARGGEPKLLPIRDGDASAAFQATTAFRDPHFLPPATDRRVLVFDAGSPSQPLLGIYDIDNGRTEVLGQGLSPFYSVTGHLLYRPNEDTQEVWALPFSAKTLTRTGDPFLVAENAQHPTVTEDGGLVFSDGASERRELVWLDRDGNTLDRLGEVIDPEAVELSPDGRLVAVMSNQGELRVYRTDRPGAILVRPGDTVARDALWSPDGASIAYSRMALAGDRRDYDIVYRPADGSGQEVILYESPQTEMISDWSGDGTHVLFTRRSPGTGFDIWRLERAASEGEWVSRPLIDTDASDTRAKLSPNGRHFAFTSMLSGRREVYVEAFPKGGSRTLVSGDGGTRPRWRDDGAELFYVHDGALMSAAMSFGPNLTVGTPHKLFESDGLDNGELFDVTADGQRFLIARPGPEGTSQRMIRFVENWYEEFRGREQD